MHLDGVLSVLTMLLLGAAFTAAVAVRSRHAAPVIASYATHVVLGLALFWSVGFFSNDAGTYDSVARSYVDYWSGSLAQAPDFAAGKEGWILILGGIYRYLGEYPELGLVFNAAAAAMTTSLIMGATARLGWDRYAKAAGWLLLMPAFLLWSSLLLRESLAWMLTALTLWAAAGLVRRNNWLDGIWLVAAIAGTLWVRGTLAAILLGGIVAGIVWARRRIPLPLIAAIAGGLVVGGPLIARFTTITGSVDLETVNASRRSLSTANSGFATVAYSSPLSVIQSLPSTVPRAVLGPFPWEFGGLPTVTVFDWAGWMLLIWLTWRGWRRIDGRSRWLPLVPAMTVLAIIGVTSGNYGTMVRLRPMAGVLLLPLAAAGTGRKRSLALSALDESARPQLQEAAPLRRGARARQFDVSRLEPTTRPGSADPVSPPRGDALLPTPARALEYPAGNSSGMPAR